MNANPFTNVREVQSVWVPIRLDLQPIRAYGVFNSIAGVRVMAASDDSACVQGNKILHALGLVGPGLSTRPLW
jgi:hypothetical protein